MRGPASSSLGCWSRGRSSPSGSCSSSRWSGWSCRASRANRDIFRSPFALPTSIDFARWAEAWEVGNIGRYALNSAIVTARLGDAHPAPRVGRRVSPSAATGSGVGDSRWDCSRWDCCCRSSRTSSPSRSCSRSSPSRTPSWRSSSRTRRWACRSRPTCSRSTWTRCPTSCSRRRASMERAMDGCSREIALPLLRPGLATVAIFSALACWNEFLLALLYIQYDDLKTIPTGLLAFSSPLPDGLLAAVLGAVDHHHPDDRHLHRLQPPHRGGHHGGQRQVTQRSARPTRWGRTAAGTRG